MESMTVRTGLLGKTVIGQHGRKIGRIQDVVFDLQSFRITDLKIKLARSVHEDLGLAYTWFDRQSVDVPVDQVSGVSDNLVLSVPLSGMRYTGGVPEAPPTQVLPESPPVGARGATVGV